MKQAAGWPNSAGTRITAVALARLQSRRSGVTVTEQIRTRAVNIVCSTDRTGSRRSRYHGPTHRTVIALTPDAMGRGGARAPPRRNGGDLAGDGWLMVAGPSGGDPGEL